MFGFFQKRKEQPDLIDQLWRHVAANNQRNPMLTETQKVAEIQSAYDALKASVVTQNTQIASLNQQVAALQQQVTNGTPATADQIAALAAVDQLDVEVEADAAASAAAAAPAPTATPATTTPAAN